MTGSILNFAFEDELQTVSYFNKNLICGAITGGIFKSTLGFKPFIVGSVFGAGIISVLTVLCDKLKEKNIIGFDIRY